MSKIIRARAPLRISFGGGGTDVSPYADERGGQVLNATINRYAYVTLVPNDSDRVRLRSLDYDHDVSFAIGEEQAPDTFGMELARGVMRRMSAEGLRSGFDLFTHTDCPPGSGLGASSTMMVALIGVFDAWLRLGLSRYETAALAYSVEREDLGIRGGKQDQYCASFGGFNFMEFGRDETLINPLRIPSEWISELEYSLILAYTGRSRQSSDIIDDQIQNYEGGRVDPVRAMDETKRLAVAMKRHLLRGEFRAFGETLHEAWVVKKEMSEKISNPLIDRLYDAAREAGALGGKISGAGGGGFMFFFAAFDRRHAVISALQNEGADVVHFGFTDEGMQTWVR